MVVDWLKGKKTYIVAVVTVLFAIIGMTGYGPIDGLTVQIQTLLAGLGLATLRAGIDNSRK